MTCHADPSAHDELLMLAAQMRDFLNQPTNTGIKARVEAELAVHRAFFLRAASLIEAIAAPLAAPASPGLAATLQAAA